MTGKSDREIIDRLKIHAIDAIGLNSFSRQVGGFLVFAFKDQLPHPG